jgi:signal transduction histidine kinase/CheY-like chemotaxis protein
MPLAAAGGLAGGTLQSAHARGLLLSASSTAVRFTFAAGETAVATAAQTWLEGADPTWTEPQQRGERNYSGLAAGHYTFHVRAVDAFGRMGPEITARFDLPQLWYLTWPTMAGYAAVLALAGVAAARWRIAALERQNRILNQLVDERTRELAARSKELELSNTAKTEFLETISHEIRNPLNGIRGFIAMLREAALPAAQQELAASLATCAGALTRVFDEVLGFSRIESGQLPLQRRSFSLPALVDEVVALHRVAARQRRCELRVDWDLPPGEPPAARRFIGDDDKIKTVLSNLISNAVKYAPGQPVDIAVAVEPDGPRAANLTVTVRDYGPGVPENEQDLIFKKFVRGSQAKDQRIPGTGLGLATCKVLLEQMGGFIGLESPPGEGGAGTSFFFKLWLRYDSEPAAPVRPEGNGAPDVGAVGRRALIVEDQDYNQVLTLRTVQRLGFEAEVAQDGPEAVRKLATGPYAVVFMDWELPGAKGDEIARHVRSLPWGPSAIIIATTGHDGEATLKACREAGMDAVVLKPFDDVMLAHALDEVRSQRGEAKAAAANGQLLDLRSFALVGQGDPAKTARAAADYLGSLQQELAELDLGLQRADWRAVASTAHRLRSHAGIVAANGLKDAAKALQEAAAREESRTAGAAAQTVRQEADAVRRQVEMATGARAE